MTKPCFKCTWSKPCGLSCMDQKPGPLAKSHLEVPTKWEGLILPIRLGWSAWMTVSLPSELNPEALTAQPNPDYLEPAQRQQMSFHSSRCSQGPCCEITPYPGILGHCVDRLLMSFTGKRRETGTTCVCRLGWVLFQALSAQGCWSELHGFRFSSADSRGAQTHLLRNTHTEPCP